MVQIPVFPFSGYVKSLRVGALPPAVGDAFESCFTEFYREPDSSAYLEAIASDYLAEKPFNSRRFSGGAELPRGRYFALCDDQQGYSGQTLAMELWAYSSINNKKIVDVVDLNDNFPTQMIKDLSGDLYDDVEKLQRKAVLVRTRALVVNEEERPDSLTHFILPYETGPLSRERAFDLRQRATTHWLIDALNTDFPNALFRLQPETEQVPSIMLEEEISSRDYKRREIVSHLQGKFFYGLKELGTEIKHILELVPYLIHANPGGTPLTNIISAYAIEQDCDCIIYPSARVDCGIFYDGPNGRHLTKSWGWNIVDTKEAPRGFLHKGISVCTNPIEQSGSGSATLVLHSTNGRDNDGWSAHGLSQTTKETHLIENWTVYLKESPLFEFGEPIIVHRTPRVGLLDVFDRKPWPYPTTTHLRAAIGATQVTVSSKIEPYHKEAPPTVGELFARLARQYTIWGEPVPSTVYAGSWFLAQADVAGNIRVLCPVCASATSLEANEANPSHVCYHCGVGEGTLGGSRQEAVQTAARALARCRRQLSPNAGFFSRIFGRA